MTYTTGNSVVYPHYGAARIERIETNNDTNVLVLTLVADNITIKVPETSATTVGLRSPHTAQEIDTLLATLQTTPDLPDENWAHHFKANQHRLASGQLAEVITIIHELHYRRLTKPLSSGEKRLYQQALTIVTSEISVSKNITINEAETLILAALPLLPTVEELTAK